MHAAVCSDRGYIFTSTVQVNPDPGGISRLVDEGQRFREVTPLAQGHSGVRGRIRIQIQDLGPESVPAGPWQHRRADMGLAMAHPSIPRCCTGSQLAPRTSHGLALVFLPWSCDAF